MFWGTLLSFCSAGMAWAFAHSSSPADAAGSRWQVFPQLRGTGKELAYTVGPAEGMTGFGPGSLAASTALSCLAIMGGAVAVTSRQRRRLLRRRNSFRGLPKSVVALRAEGTCRDPLPTDVTEKAYFDITIGGEPVGRLVFGLYGDVVPRTVQNFRELCANDRDADSYKDCPFHRIITGFMCQGGDFTNRNGTGGRSIYGGAFADENFQLSHCKPGLLSMANAGPNTNGSQFFITTAATEWLDGAHVVFGEVMEGMEVLAQMESVGSSTGETQADVAIADAGVL